MVGGSIITALSIYRSETLLEGKSVNSIVSLLSRVIYGIQPVLLFSMFYNKYIAKRKFRHPVLGGVAMVIYMMALYLISGSRGKVFAVFFQVLFAVTLTLNYGGNIFRDHFRSGEKKGNKFWIKAVVIIAVIRLSDTMGKSKIAASMMCADLINLKDTIKIFEDKGVEYLHIDVMDGEFVPNFGLGVDYIRGIRELTKIPLDLHLMIKDPEYKLQWIGIKETDIVSIHYESTYQVQRALDWLAPFGCKKFLAINPATPIYVLEEVLDYIDGINLLMVNPGFAGQKIVPSTLKKAARIQEYLQERNKENITIEVDGNITPENGAKLKKNGASIFVCGTSSVFKGTVFNYSSNIDVFRNAVK